MGYTLFDLDTGTLTLSFSEPMLVSSLTTSGALGLQAHVTTPPLSGEEDYNITSLSCPTCSNGNLLSLQINTQDLNAIKLKPQVCTDISDCWITIPAPGDLLTDMLGNNILPLPTDLHDTRRTPVAFLPDTSQPQLLYFELDLSNRTITLVFNEPVSVGSLVSSGITLLSSLSQTHEDYIHTFQQLTSVSQDGTTIECLMSSDDVSAILIRTGLAVSAVS